MTKKGQVQSKDRDQGPGLLALLEDLGKEKLAAMFRRMLEIREFEERIRFLFLEGKMPGTVHQYIGMEACAVGVCTALEEHDVIASTHRPHGHAIARGVSMESIMGELYGKSTGCCLGKGGSMHVGDLERGMLPAIAIVGGNLPIVMGMGLAFKIRKEPRVAVSFFGDGASNEGAFHEALNMASVYGVPAVFVCENNLYGASTSIKRVTRIEHISDRADAYGMRGDRADGMDVLEVYTHAKDAADRARRGEGPTLLELEAFRLCGHSRRDPNNYMTDEEKEYWQRRDPIPSFEKLLIEHGILSSGEVEELKTRVQSAVEEAIAYGQESPDPDDSAMYDGLYVNMEVPR
jgi:pyruvate dehydrogenase E1 component alpha subunit